MTHILRCDHHHVCWMLRFNNRCKNDGQPKPVCMFDTRLHSNATERDKVLISIQEFKEEMWKKYGDNVMPIWELTNLIKSIRTPTPEAHR